jgi:hypothetical protein
LTRKQLEKHSWSLDQCEKMAQDTLEGESVLMGTSGSAKRLQQLLGVEERPVLNGTTGTSAINVDPASDEGDRPAKRRGRYVGERKPKRDKIGKEASAG